MRKDFTAFVAVVACTGALLACKKGSTGEATPAASAEAQKTPGVLFSKKVPGVGAKRTEDAKNEIEVQIEAKRAGRVIHSGAFKKNEREKKRVEVLAANDTAVTKVKVTYLEKFDAEAEGKAALKRKPSPVSGKSYTVEAVNGSVEVHSDSGGSVPSKEKKIVADDFKDLGKPDKFTSFIQSRPLLDGEKLLVTADIVREMFGSKDGDEMSVDSATFTFRGTRTEGPLTYGTFDVSFKLTASPKDQDLGMVMDLEGKVTVDTATSWPIEMNLKGPLTMKGKSDKAGVELDGKGSMTAGMTAQYE